MDSRPNDDSERTEDENDLNASYDSIDARVRTRAQDTRRFIFLLVFIGVVLSGFFGYFIHLKSAAVDVDLRLAVDAYAREGDRVLLDAEVLDPRSGRVRFTPGVYLEVWRNGARDERWKVQGSERRAIRMGDRPIELRLVHASEGPVQPSVSVVVKPGDPMFVANVRPQRGGVNSSPGQGGLRRVRTRDACGWRMDAVAYGGVPVASIRTPTLFRVLAADGQPVRDVELEIRGAGTETHRVRTDSEGLAVAGLQMSELSYVEVTANCSEGEHYTGFEAQPVYDGLAVTKLVNENGGVRAAVQDITQRRDARYDLRCDGALRAFGQVPRSGVIEISAEQMGAVRKGTSCVLQVYRAVFATHASYAVRHFQWGMDSLAWDWAQQADGVTLIGLSTYGRSFDVDGEAIAAWREAGYQRVRVGIAVVLGLSMFLWFAFVWWDLGTRRQVSEEGVIVHDERPESMFDMRLNPVLWSGWAAIGISLGSLYVVLWLMGL